MSRHLWTAGKITAWLVGAVGFAILCFIISYGVVFWIMSEAPQENTKRVTSTVYQVCEISRHQDDNGALEDACGAAQDVSNTEYLCSKWDGTHPRVCWVEDKLNNINEGSSKNNG